MDVSILLSAFLLIAVTELGDKTMVAVITLSSKHGRREVFLGAVSALAAVSALGALIGGALFEVIPEDVLTLAAGCAFILFGIYTLLKEENEEAVPVRNGNAFLTTFSLIALMEMGDKSQLSILTLAAGSGSYLLVLIGAILAFGLIVALEVLLGERIGRVLKPKVLRLGGGAVFLVFGTIFLVQALL
jgi:putative Ca2+/H+ antiporter (TMEM165/GDT1 family)